MMCTEFGHSVEGEDIISHRGRKLKQFLVSGYLSVSLCKAGKYKQNLVHRLIWEWHNGPIPEGMAVDHINNNRLDNRIENLQLLTPAENAEKSNALNWTVTDPDGAVYEVFNLNAFCKANQLDQGTMWAVSIGKYKNHKGWQCQKS